MERRNRILNHTAAGWFLLACFLLLAQPSSFLNDAARLAALPLCAGALLLLTKRASLVLLFTQKSRTARRVSLLFTALFFLFLSVPNLLSAPLFSETGLSGIWWRFRLMRLALLVWNYVGLLSAYALSVWLCLFFIWNRFTAPRPIQAPLPHPATPWFAGPFQYTALLAGFCLCVVLSATPSFVIGDAPFTWAAARDNGWSEWHTAGYLLYLKLLQLVYPSQRIAVAVQTLAYIYTHHCVLSLLAAHKCGTRAYAAYTAATALVFVPVFFLQALIKDVVFTTALLGFGAGALRLVCDPDDGAPRAVHVITTGVFGLFCCLFRHAGWLPVAATLPALFFIFLKRQKRAAVCVLCAGAGIAVCYTLLIVVLARGVLQFERNPSYIKYGAPMNMVGAVAASGAEIAPEDRAVMERIMPVEKWAACYLPYISDNISRIGGDIGADVLKIETEHFGPELIRLNAKFLVKYPRIYLKAFFDLNSLMWEIATPSDGYVRSYLTYPDSRVQALIEESGYAQYGRGTMHEFKQAPNSTYTGFADAANRYAELLYNFSLTRSLLWRGGFANLVTLFAAAVLVKKRRTRALAGLLPIAAVTLGMLISMPAQEVRYILPNLEYALLAGVYAYFAPEKA